MEHDRAYNEKDPELSKYFKLIKEELFSLLSNGDNILSKRKLFEIIVNFDLPLRVEEFFAPLGKTEDLTFSDFCSLFKSKSYSSDIFYKTFASSFNNASQTIVKDANVFPIHVIPK